MIRDSIVKNLKHYLKKKKSITMSFIVVFLISGTFSFSEDYIIENNEEITDVVIISSGGG